MALVMGTAGHIDHGKTSLVRCLTGIDCDRLQEEKKRGITIELGFAFFDLPEKNSIKERMGVIDVPGHERFVRNMVAGANGIDFVLLVIAADEGVMPQTVEHLEICRILNIKHGMIALTKIDMVDEELLALAKEDVREFVQGSFLENASIFPVSTMTNEGIPALQQEIFAQTTQLHPKRRHDIFRMPVDRVFTLKGHGTLVTGTLISGHAKTGDEVQLMPSARLSRIRSIQNHGQSVDEALAGHRISLNLMGLDVTDISRGDIFCSPHSLFPSNRWIVALNCLTSCPRPLRHRREVHFHHGAKEVMARLYFYDQEVINPGETALCEVRFSEPMTGLFLDKCVIRAFSPLQTVAGASILIPLDDAPKRRQISREWQDKLLALPNMFHKKDPQQAVFTQIYFGHPHGISQKKLSVLTPFDEKQLEKIIQSLMAQQQIFLYDKEQKIFIAASYIDELCQSFKNIIAKFHVKESLRPAMPKAALLSGNIPSKLAHFILEKLVKQNNVIAEADGVRLKEHNIALKANESQLKDAIAHSFITNPLNPPLLKELIAEHKSSQKEILDVLQLLIMEYVLVKITEGMYFHATVIEEIQTRMLNFFQHNKSMLPADFKEISKGLTRKYSIPVLEYFDKERTTMRVEDGRQLRNTALLEQI